MNSGATKTAAVPVSTFPLSKGYAIELGTLPSSTSAAKAKQAEQSDKAKGASGVGLLSQATYTMKPSPPSGDYVVYTGSYSSRAAAEKALAGLKHKFPGAKVIEVKSAASASGGGKVLNKTPYGSPPGHRLQGRPRSRSSRAPRSRSRTAMTPARRHPGQAFQMWSRCREHRAGCGAHRGARPPHGALRDHAERTGRVVL